MYTYFLSRTGWSETQILLPDTGNDDMHFGVSVAVNGGRLVVGASGANGNGIASGTALTSCQVNY